MGDKTGISWTDATWNPIRGCTRVSAGCVHCYAETIAHRFSGAGQPYEGLTDSHGRWNGNIKQVPSAEHQPSRWARARRIFVNSMSDLFHPAVERDWLDAIFKQMEANPRHVFQCLTKRADVMHEYLLKRWGSTANAPWHIWVGVSVEDAKVIDRIATLRATPAQVRFLSCEPLIGPLEALELDGISWVIIGGESGTGARPLRAEWVNSIVEQTERAGATPFVKQFGSVFARAHGWHDRAGADPAEWRMLYPGHLPQLFPKRPVVDPAQAGLGF